MSLLYGKGSIHFTFMLPGIENTANSNALSCLGSAVFQAANDLSLKEDRSQIKKSSLKLRVVELERSCRITSDYRDGRVGMPSLVGGNIPLLASTSCC